MLSRFVTLMLLLVCITSLSSCRWLQVSNAKAAMEEKLDPLLAKSKQDVLMAVGAPRGSRHVGGMEVWD